MQTFVVKVLVVLGLLAGFFFGGYRYGITKSKTPEKETKIEYVDRVVEKEVKVYVKEKVKENTKTTTTKPDGTIIVKEKNVDSNTEVISTVEEKTKEITVSVDKKNGAKQWRASVLIGTLLPDWREMKPIYGGQLDRRLVGPVSAGAWYLNSKDKAAGLSISLEF